jgi:hypothetical protein
MRVTLNDPREVATVDDLIPRAMRSGFKAVSSASVPAWVIRSKCTPPVYRERFEDAIRMLQRGCCATEVREKHGAIVLRDAEFEVGIQPRTGPARGADATRASNT